jgi:heme-degrading monooxygenase HmoA
MIGRLWTTRLRPGWGEAYEQFAREISLPMFRQQEGFVGCVMSRTPELGFVYTFWRDQAAIDALDQSPSYQATVKRILEAGILDEPQTLQVAEVHLVDLAALPTTA